MKTMIIILTSFALYQPWIKRVQLFLSGYPGRVWTSSGTKAPNEYIKVSRFLVPFAWFESWAFCRLMVSMRAATGKDWRSGCPSSFPDRRSRTCHFAVLMNHESLDEFSSIRRILPVRLYCCRFIISHANQVIQAFAARIEKSERAEDRAQCKLLLKKWLPLTTQRHPLLRKEASLGQSPHQTISKVSRHQMDFILWMHLSIDSLCWMFVYFAT